MTGDPGLDPGCCGQWCAIGSDVYIGGSPAGHAFTESDTPPSRAGTGFVQVTFWCALCSGRGAPRVTSVDPCREARMRSWTALLLLIAACHRDTASDLRTQPVTRGRITEVVSATGEVSAVGTVTVGSQISGAISKLFVDWNSEVKAGQALAEIDPRLFQVAQARAAAGLSAANADVQRAKVTLADTRLAARRLTDLFAGKLVARAEVDTAVSNRDAAAAALLAAEARVLQAKADLDAARTNLALCSIRSPVDGVVISRNVDVGQTVAASLQSPVLFVIAKDLSRMQ